MSTNAKTAKAEVLINSAIVPVSQVVLRHKINELPQVTFNLQLDNRDGGSTGIDLPTYIKFVGDQQNYLVNRFRRVNGRDLSNQSTIDRALQADLAVRVVDGDGKVLNFSGFLTQPTFNVQQGEIGLMFNGVHSMAAIQNLNLQLYSMVQLYAIRNLTLPTGANESFNSIGTHMDAIILNIFKQFEDGLNPGNRNYSELAATHQINKAIYEKFVKNFLTVSKGRTIVPLVNAIVPEKVKGSLQARVDGEIGRILLGGQNFLDVVLQGLVPDFKFQMNANWNGQAWLEVIRTQENVGDRSITAPIESISFSVASSIEAPIQRVYVRCGRLDLYGLLDMISQGTTLRQMSAYPPITEEEKAGKKPNLAPGVAYVTDAPAWLQDDVATADTISPTDNSDHSLAASLSKFRAREQSFLDTQLQREDIMQWLAEFTYKEHFLRYTSAVMSVPLMLEAEVGKTYLVNSPDGTKLFTGFLDEVSHSIVLGQKDGVAQTVLHFSHVKVAGVEFDDLSLSRYVAQSSMLADVETFTPSSSSKILPDTDQIGQA